MQVLVVMPCTLQVIITKGVANQSWSNTIPSGQE